MFRHLFNSKSFHRGVTLIEVVAVISIMSILALITLVSWSDSRVRQDIILAEREFTAAVRQAQGYALTGKLDMSAPDRIPCQYLIHREGNTSYSIKYTVSTGSTSCSSDAYLLQTFTLPNGVTSDTSWASKDIKFSLPDGKPVNGNPAEVSFRKSTKTGLVCLPTVSGLSVSFTYSVVNDEGGSCP